MRLLPRINPSIVLAILWVILPLSVNAQESDTNETLVYGRGLGSQIFQIDLGVGVPLFSFPDANGELVPGANLSLGGMGALKWSTFLNETLALGFDLSGFISEGPNGNAFTSFPLGIRVSNFFRVSPSIQIPIHLSTALNIMRYKDLNYIGLGLKPGVSVYWDATKDWSFGINAQWWLLPELYLNPEGSPPDTHTRVGNVLEITLSALYNFNN